MKNGRSRRHSSHGRGSAVTTLPPRRPPSQQSPTRPSPAAKAIPLPNLSEPLVEASSPVAVSRQARRQEQRAHAKELRRSGAQPLPRGAAAAPTEPEPLTETTPLPRNRSLALQRNGIMHIAEWVRGLFIRQPRSQRMTPDLAVRQIQAMRLELAHMQRTLERMLSGSA